jgi:putative tryptophan/tyrosine transport system substrate-binding protein
VNRREFITLIGGAAAYALLCPLAARAAGLRPRIAVLTLNSARDEGKVIAAFLEAMRALGYTADQTMDIDYRHAEGDTNRLKSLAQELIALKPDVALANSPSPAFALKSIAPALPIVCPQLSDSVLPGLAASYARPGGSVTGIATYVEGLAGKLFELALEVVPGSARIGFLVNPAGASMALFERQAKTAAHDRGVTLLSQEARTADDLVPAFDGFVRERVQAVVIPTNGLFVTNGRRIAQLAIAARLPTIHAYARDVEAGGLASYGVDVRENTRRSAGYVDKILKGAKPGDLPIEFPTKVELVINLKTAKALGLTVPATLLARADEVIE